MQFLIGIPFGPSGATHCLGLVPDPGPAAGDTRFLCENATWKVPAGSSPGVTYATPAQVLAYVAVGWIQ